MIETQMAIKAKQVDELNTQATYLEKTVPEKIDDIKAKKSKVEERFQQLRAPLLERQNQLAKKKEALQVNIDVIYILRVMFRRLKFVQIKFFFPLQFRRDVEDEKLWISEKKPLALNINYGNSLYNVHMLKKKNQVSEYIMYNHKLSSNLDVCNEYSKFHSHEITVFGE